MASIGVVLPCARVMRWRVKPFALTCQLPLLKLRSATAPPPSSVIIPPPSMTVLVVVGRFRVEVIGIVTGSSPQSKVTIPPWEIAAESAANVQLADEPLPTTVVGLDVSTSWPREGTPPVHVPPGFPGAKGGALPSVSEFPPDPPEVVALEPVTPVDGVVPSEPLLLAPALPPWSPDAATLVPWAELPHAVPPHAASHAARIAERGTGDGWQAS